MGKKFIKIFKEIIVLRFKYERAHCYDAKRKNKI